MELKANNTKIIEDSGTWLCFRTDEINKARAFIDNKKDTPYRVEAKEWREKRSLNANSYAWLLIGKLADALRTDKDSMYCQMLERYGQGVMVSILTEAADAFRRTVKYRMYAGESELNGREFTHFVVYTGSSEYGTAEMSILIDGIVSECKELGIETMTPEELERIKGEWAR